MNPARSSAPTASVLATRRRWLGSALFVIAVHVSALVGLPDKSSQNSSPPAGFTAVIVTFSPPPPPQPETIEPEPEPIPELLTVEVPKAEPVLRKKPKEKPRKKPEPKPVVERKIKPSPEPAQEPLEAAEYSQSEAQPSAAPRPVSGSFASGPPPDYASLLSAWLEKHKEYPRRARMRRQEGVVLLSFVMDRSGHVLSYQIEKGSGYALLDEEVEALIQRAQPLPPMPDNMREDRLELAVPINFNLRSRS